MLSVLDREKIRGNIPKVYVLNFFMMFLVTIPIIVPYWKQLGISLKEVYQLQAIFGLMMIILDVPAGYVSDLFGRKICLIMVGLFNGLTYFLLLNGKTFWHFALFEVSAAIAFALYSGCDIALLYDSIDAVDEGDNLKKMEHSKTFLGRRIFYSQVGEATGSFLGGIVAVYSLRYPAMINAVTAWIPLLIALTIVEPPRKKFESLKHWDNFRVIFNGLFKHSRLMTLLIIFNIIYGFSSFLAVWAYQSYWEEINIPISWFGTLWAALNISVALIARFSHRIEQRWGASFVIFLVSMTPIIAYLGLGLTASYWSLFFMLFFSIGRSLNGAILQEGINSRVPSTMRATTNSFCSLGMRGVFFLVGPLFGHMLDQSGIHFSFTVMGLIFVFLFFIVALPLLKRSSEFKV